MTDYPISGPPSIGRERFIRLLALAGSPAAPEGWAIWDALVRRGVDPLVFAAMFMRESRMGLAGVTPRYDTRNPGNVRSVQNPEHGGVVIQTERGPFVKYASWLLGAQDWADRLRGPKYEGVGLTTVRQVIPKYAPAGDGNSPDAYIAAVLAFIERHRDRPGGGATVPTMPPLTIDYVRAGAVNRPGQRITPRYFTVHETANPTVGAAGHRAYVHNGGGPQQTSYNYVVDDREAFGLIPIGEASYHAGTPQGNLSGVSMEMCVNSAPDSPEWRRTVDHGLAIVAATYAKTPDLLPVEEGLVPHRHWRATACPARLTGAAWEAFRARAVALVNGAGQSEDARMEAYYQANAARLGAKRYAAMLALHYYSGTALVCERGVVTPDGEIIAGNIVDDWLTHNAALIVPLTQ